MALLITDTQDGNLQREPCAGVQAGGVFVAEKERPWHS
jgi:hypothetical protein